MPKNNPILKMAADARRKHPQRSGKSMKEWKIQAPKAASSVLSYGPAQMTSTKTGMRVRHSELMATVAGSVSFTSESYSVNPGLSATFPWLSAIANNFEAFKVHSLQLRYVPRVSTNTAGLILLSADYNSGDPRAITGPVTEQEVSSTPGAVECPAWASAIYRLDPSRFAYPKYFTRQNRVDDLELYDPAVIYVATTAMADTSYVGRIYIEYDIELRIPQYQVVTNPEPSKTSTFQILGPINVAVGSSATIEFSPNFNPLGIVRVGFTGLKFEPGAYLLEAQIDISAPYSTAGCPGAFKVMKNSTVLAVDPNFAWAADYVDFISSIGTSGTVSHKAHVRGVIVLESQSDVITFIYEATVGGTAGFHNIATAGSYITLQNA